MTRLNLPPFAYKVQQIGGKAVIYDIIRKKNVALTPEEWVRQHMIHYLINHLCYPKGLIKVESGLKYNQLAKRSDILVYTRNGQPLLLVECKSYHVELDDAVFEQSAIYNSTLQAEFILISNGLEHYCCRIDHLQKAFTFLEHLPAYAELTI